MLLKLRSAAMVGALLLPTAAQSAEITAHAKVNIVSAFAISASDLDFGALAISTAACAMDPSGRLTGSHSDCTGQRDPGALRISGPKGHRVSIVASSGRTQGIQFSPEWQQQQPITLHDRVQVLPFGGALTLTAPEAGAHQINYRIVANFE